MTHCERCAFLRAIIACCHSAAVTALKKTWAEGLVNQRSNYQPHADAKRIPSGDSTGWLLIMGRGFSQTCAMSTHTTAS